MTFSVLAWILLFHLMLTQGIDCRRQGSGREQVQVSIIACGTLSTPSLLKRSGLKNANIGEVVSETWDVEGLYLADTSVVLVTLGVNPIVIVRAIACCTAQSVLEVLKGKED